MTEQLVVFMWQEARPDNREFRQNSSVLVLENFKIGVPVPTTAEYVLNAEEILKAELGSGNKKKPDPIFTPKAIQYCLDKLGEFLTDPEDVSPEDLQSTDWDDTVSTDSSEDWTETQSTEDNWDNLEEGKDDKELPWEEDWS